MAQYIRGNNKHRGFFFRMADGCNGWVHGLSKTEWNRMEKEHGRFIIYERA